MHLSTRKKGAQKASAFRLGCQVLSGATHVPFIRKALSTPEGHAGPVYGPQSPALHATHYQSQPNTHERTMTDSNQCISTVNDVITYPLREIRSKRANPLEDAFQEGYERAFNDIMYELLPYAL